MSNITRFNRLPEAQRIGTHKIKESIDQAISMRQQGMADSPFVHNFVSTPDVNDQYQQRVVLLKEQEINMQALRERDKQLRELKSNIAK